MSDLENGMVVGNSKTDNGADPYPEERDEPSMDEDEPFSKIFDRIKNARNFSQSERK